MATITVIPLSEYLDTSYRPDREYIDGELRERNVGESDHSRLQTLLIGYLLNRETQWGIVVMAEQRVQVKPNRFRVPDITVVAGRLPGTPILHEPPFLCIEILSRGDSMEDMQERIDDYLTFGVRHVWVINPRTRRAFLYTSEGMKEAKDGFLRTLSPDVEVPIAALG
ncbi:MAG TPA: Uma2 family endonuclease [Bryobacteraceae bacterium]|nr:Uma2 family endonuclease [Bryobacteraceae bacterium]